MDFFIDRPSSGGLKDDDRDHADPFGGDVPLEESRAVKATVS